MIAFICLFLPAVIGVWLFEHLQKAPLCRKQWLYRYCASTLLINGICFGIKRFLLGTGGEPFYSLYTDTTPAAGVNYLIMAIPAAVLVSFLQIVFAKHATITVEEQEDA